MADVRRDFVVVAVNTALGNQDITISGFGTPKAAEFYLTEAVTDDTIASNGAISVGFTDGTDSQVVSVANEDAQTSTDTQRTPGFDIGRVAIVPNPNGATKFALDFVSWITDGVRVSVDTNTVPSGYLLKVILWGGADLTNVKCVSRGLQSSTSAQVYTGIGFEFDALFLAHCYASSNGGLIHSPFSFGCVINDNATTPTQKSVGFCGDSGSSSGDQNTVASDTYALVAPLIGANRWNLTISDITSTGYTHTTSSSTSVVSIQLALKFAAGVDFSLTDVSIPTTGNLVESGLSFTPEYTTMALIQGPSAYDTLDTSAPSASLAIAHADTSKVHVHSTSDEDGSADTVCKSLSSDQFRMLDYQGSADAVLASSYSLDSGGWTYTLSTNPAAAILGWAFAFSGGAAGPTYTLTAAKGSYSLTGQAAALTASRKLTADKGSYSYTGYAAGLRSGRKLLAAKGSYAITGYGANLKAARVLTASKGAYALTGYAATLTYTPISGPTYTLTANAGSYAYTGYDAILRASRVLAAGNGSYTLTGYNAALNYSGNVAAEAYTFAGGPFAGSAFSGSQVEGIPATADTVTLTFVADVGSLAALSSAEVEILTSLSESTDLQALVTTGFSDPRAFFWPSVNGYQVKPLVDPLDQMHFLTVGTDTAKQVAADAGFTQIHTNPVKVDRFGNIPAVFVDSASEYRFILKNQFGVTKWEAGSYTWPNTVEDHLFLSPISETNTLVALTTSEP